MQPKTASDEAVDWSLLSVVCFGLDLAFYFDIK